MEAVSAMSVYSRMSMKSRMFYIKSDYAEVIGKIVQEAKCQFHDIICTVCPDYVQLHNDSEDVIKQFELFFVKKVPSKALIYSQHVNSPVDFDDIRKFQIYTHLLLGRCISQTFKILKECFEKYTLKTMFLSFNGGKDCVVLLHLLLAVMKELKLCGPLKVVYFRSDDQFPEEEEYVHLIEKKYDLDLEIIEGELKGGLTNFLTKNPEFRASVIGTRQSDNDSTKLQFFQNTDPGWPPLIRVQPLINWNYETVWSFLRQFSIPYCCLYDKGYTSLGNKSNSKPNPHLKYIDEETREIKYLPAFLLQNVKSERQSRL
ncbi:FAD synthase isoform X3 [Adelges cooleyi]|nr:FAD synthase isoform X3 [Adelges cooleyi]XP_050434347.1 FAD synthase isoform X3 [Adelges cooleyi]